MKINKVNIFIYLLTFVVIYTPTFFSSDLINYLLPFVYFLITILLTLRINKENRYKKKIYIIVYFELLALVLFIIRTLIAGTDIYELSHLRIVQSIQFIISFISIYNINTYLSHKSYNEIQKIDFLCKICMIQFMFVIMMILFPNLREVLLNRFYMYGQGNYWTYSKRVYGIMSNYTYSGSIFHGIMIVVAYVYGVMKEKRLFIYIPFLLIIVLLNGRTGLYIAISGIMLTTIFIVSKKNFIKLFFYIFTMLIVLASTLLFLKNNFNSTYIHLVNGTSDILNFVTKREEHGNIDEFSKNIKKDLNFKSFMIGNGYRIQNKGDIPKNIVFEGDYSDIGYINDMYMCGLLYMVLLYIPLFLLIFSGDIKIKEQKALSIFLLFAFLISNFKGEFFRSSILMCVIIYIKQLCNDNTREESEYEKSVNNNGNI